MDNGTNSHGLKMIDLCKRTSLRIANGRLHDDKGVGYYTYCNKQGASVIDYLLLRASDFYCIDKFKIESFNEWSDHAPLSYMILVSDNNQRPVNKVNSYVSIKLQDNQKYCFRRKVIGKLSEFNHITEGIDVNSKESVNSRVNSFTDLLNSAAEPLFHKTVNVNDNIGTTNTKAEWFDAECAAAKFEYKKALHNFYRVKSIHSIHMICVIRNYAIKS